MTQLKNKFSGQKNSELKLIEKYLFNGILEILVRNSYFYCLCFRVYIVPTV